MTNISLYNLALEVLYRTYDTNDELLDVNDIQILEKLPFPLQIDFRKKLKERWMFKVRPSSNRHTYEYRYLDLPNLFKSEFVMLMHHPREMPLFWPYWLHSSCHAYFNFYELKYNSSESVSVCRPCFQKLSHPSSEVDEEFPFNTYWSERGWRFFKITKHKVIEAEEIIKKVIKRRKSWCGWCVLEPLFDLYTWDMCKNQTHEHDDYDSDASLESNPVSMTYHRKEIFNPFSH